MVVAALAVLGVLALWAAMRLVGVVPALAVAAVLAWLPLLVMRPGVAVGVLLVPAVLLEGQPGELGAFPEFYTSLPAHTTPLELLLIVAALGVLVHGANETGLRAPWPLSWALVLLVIAILIGMVVGVTSQVDRGLLFTSARHLAYLALVPFVVVNLWRDHQTIRRVLGIGAALTIAKAILGLISLRAGTAFHLEGTSTSQTTFTYYEPTVNFLSLLYLLFVLGALLRRVKLPWWVLLGTPIVFASLLLSYRRSFWIGAVLGLLVVLILAAGPAGRPLMLLLAALLGVAFYLTVATGTVKDVQVQGPIVKRFQTLNPSRLVANPEDRYRLDERRNVWAEITDHPITGLGLAQPWTARYPLPVEHTGGRDYVHFAALWYWLKLGLLGLIAYLALTLTGIRAGYRTWRRAGDPLLQVAGLAIGTSLISLSAVETTATFTGVDPRFTIILGATLGLVAALARLTRKAEA
jgi:O-antigen ligase